MTDDRQALEPDKPEPTPCPVCAGKGYINHFVYCGACWGTGNGALDKTTANRLELDLRWSNRVNRLAAQDRPWER